MSHMTPVPRLDSLEEERVVMEAEMNGCAVLGDFCICREPCPSLHEWIRIYLFLEQRPRLGMLIKSCQLLSTYCA